MRASARPEKRDWYHIRNAAEEDDGPTEILIYDEIGYSWWGGVSAKDFAKDLGAITDDKIDVRLNSPGGDVYDGIAILNALRAHKARITVYVDGLAASAASFIAMAGDEIIMRRNSEMMIHDASCFGGGNAGEMRKVADDLDRVSNNVASIYADRAGGTAEEWRAIMLAETWYTAQEAVDAGLANRVEAKVETEEDDKAAKNSFDLSIFNYAGRRAAPAPPISAHLPAERGAAKRATAPLATSTEKGNPTMAFTDDQVAELRDALSLAEDATDQEIFDAVLDALTAPAETGGGEDGATASAVQKFANANGMLLVDASGYEQTRAMAARGAQALDRQEERDREEAVSAAIHAGKIPTAAKAHWLKALAADPSGAMAAALEGLAPGLIPVTAIGHGVGVETSTDTADLGWFDTVTTKEA